MLTSGLSIALIVGFLLGLAFVVMAILNVREHIAKNRRITAEYKDQKRWEQFYNRESR